MVVDLPVPEVVEVDPMLQRRSVNTYRNHSIEVDSHRSLICLAMVKNACSTFVAFLAEVSKKGIESWSANSYAITLIFRAPLYLIKLTHLRHAVFHNLLAGQVRLVADKQLIHAFGSIAVNLLQPLLDIREGVYRNSEKSE